MSETNYSKVARAAQAGDREAQAALEAMDAAADKVTDTAHRGIDTGRDEARRRFGRLTSDPPQGAA